MAADLTKVVEIIFGAVDRDTKSTIDNIQNSLSTFDASIQGVADPVAKFTENLLKAEAAIAGLAAAYGGYAISEAAKFQSAQIDLNKVLSDGDPAIETFTQSVTDLSDRYGISADVILQGVANFKQAGFTAAEAANLQKNALDLMIAGDVEAAQASQVLITSIKGFGAEASSASRFIEALNNVSNDYATDVPQLAAGMARIAPIAHAMGFSFEEATGLLTPMIEIFGSGEQAAEGLKTGLLKLTDDTKDVRAALAQLGVSQFDLNGQMRSGKDIFYDVANAFSKLDENQKAYLTQQLVGIDQAPRMVLAFSNLAKIQQITASAMAETGSVTKEIELRLASAEIQIDRFRVGFENLVRVVGSEILTQFSGIVGGATEIEIAFRKIVADGGLSSIFDALKPQMAEFEEALKTIAQNLPEAFKNIDFSGLLESFGNLGNEFKDALDKIFNGADLSTVEGLHKAIQSTVNILAGLVNVTREIINQFDPIFAAIGEAGKQISNSSTETEASAGKLLGAMTILGEFGTVLGTTILTINESKTSIAGVFDTLVGASRILTNSLQTAFDALALAISNGIAGWADNIAKFLDFVGADEQAKKFHDASAEFTLYAEAAKDSLVSNSRDIQDAWDQMSNGLTSSSTTASQSLTKVGNASEQPKDSFKALGVDSKALVDSFETLGYTLDPVTGKLEKVANSSGRTEEEIRKIIDAVDGSAKAVDGLSKGFATLGEAESFAASATDKFGDIQIRYENGLYNVTGTALKAADSHNQLGDSAKKAADKAFEGSEAWKRVQDVMIESQKVTNDFNIKMGELANKRYEIAVKASVDLQTAEIEAQTARINAALSSMTETIGTLTAGSTDLWGLFEKKAGFTGSSELEEAAKRMEQRLDKELDLKEELTRAIVEQAQSMTQRLNSGQALIQIDGGDLSPELEMIFDKILKYTQTRTTQEGLALLLGV